MGLAADQCTLFLIRSGELIRRFDVCSGTFLPDFAPLSVAGRAIRVLPDGGVLVVAEDFTGLYLKRYNSSGAVVRTYPLEYYGYALMLADGGTQVIFGQEDCEHGRQKTIDLASGATLSTINLQTATPTSLVASSGWTAALGPTHLAAAIPAMGTIALITLGALFAALAVTRLR